MQRSWIVSFPNLLRSISRPHRRMKGKVNEMDRIFICSPYAGDTETNVKRAAGFARLAIGMGYMPIVPHLYFPNFLQESIQEERMLGIELGFELMRSCQMMWLLSVPITPGMLLEIKEAEKLNLPIQLYDTERNQIGTPFTSEDDRFTALVQGIHIIHGKDDYDE